MSDPSESRAEELEQRLQDQPGSRLFVQLAEEYRRLERYDDAIRTLEKGLEDQPTYLSARVLLGRCRLESGDPSGAIPELEQVLRQDQTHLLAHKLLARAHLETGDVEAARERLSLYEMLNESDPEIDELRARLAGGASSRPKAQDDEPLDDELFDLGTPEPPVPTSRDDDLLGVWEAESEPEVSTTPEAPAAREPPPAGGDEPFGDLWSPDDRRRLDHGFAEEGLFGEPVETAPQEPAETEDAAEAPEAAEEPEEPEERATVTLGRLYLQQGHHDEARRIFREVLDREPDHAEARAELLRLDAQPEPDLEVAPVPAPEPAEPAPEPLTAADLEEPGAETLGLTERKVRMLDGYLQRIRRAAEQHVR